MYACVINDAVDDILRDERARAVMYCNELRSLFHLGHSGQRRLHACAAAYDHLADLAQPAVMAEIGNLLKLVLTRDDDYLLDQRIILKREYRPHQNRHRAELHKYFVRTHALGAARRDYDCRAFRRLVLLPEKCLEVHLPPSFRLKVQPLSCLFL